MAMAQGTHIPVERERFTWVLLAALLCLAGLPSGARAAATVGPAVSYTAFDGSQHRLHPWVGRNVALLTPTDTLDAATISQLVDALDDAYDFYAELVGGRPTLAKEVQGRLSIAVVPSTCGAACGYLGATGIEILTTQFPVVYEALRVRGQYDQALFYELGRNFWLFGSQLASLDPLVTGFAILGRFLAMEAGNLPGAPFNGMPFEAFRDSILVDLLARYVGSPALSWDNTLAVGTAPPNPNNWGAADLAATLLNVIRTDHGLDAFRSFWRAVRRLPAAETPLDAVGNLIRAAKDATTGDYRNLFRGSALAIEFGPPPGAPLRVRFTNGTVLEWGVAGYVERPGDIGFAVRSVSPGTLMLRDGSRDLLWEIPLVRPPTGLWRSRWHFGGNWVDAYVVGAIDPAAK